MGQHMYIRSLFSAFLAIQSFGIYGSDFQWLNWYVTDSQNYLEKLKKVKPAHNAHHAAQAAKKALQAERWDIAVAEIESAVAKDPHNIHLWLDLAYTAAIAREKVDNYDYRSKAQNAATYVYT